MFIEHQLGAKYITLVFHTWGYSQLSSKDLGTRKIRSPSKS